ncbi:hypothetical protein FHL15_007314 [Xylaria flabelliformis]|uniref:Uncharacterized protein n=1 Tax=Xylaria flabelliformis TaxID=2512241 RepID=A0A553HUY4_9PEZI|nr:hypothetical protein FHL15_007314 [Xylaria flabelliformis]
MANRGDLSLAKQLQAEFSRAKAPNRKGRRAGGADNFQAPLERQYQPSPPPQFGRQSERIISNRGRGRNQGQRTASSTVYHPRPAWQGELVTNDSPGSEPVFPSSTPFATAANKSSSNSLPSSKRTSARPLDQRTNQVLPKAPLDTTQPASAVAFQHKEHAQQIEEQEDIKMGDSDYPSSPAPKPTTTNLSKGLSGSMWNPANENARADSTHSSQVKPRSNTSSSAKEVEIVTSGITKGPGLKASR